MSKTAPINQKQLRQFLYRLGFTGAAHWDEDKLRSMAMEAGKHLKEEEVPKASVELLRILQAYAKTGKYINWAPPLRKDKQ